MNPWIGVDLDATLAVYDHWRGPTHIGEPVPLMVDRVKHWLAAGIEVKILTARVSHDGTPSRQADSAQALLAIQKWCLEHIGAVLPVTCEKDYGMVELYDDRAKQVVQNTGELIEDLYQYARERVVD